MSKAKNLLDLQNIIKGDRYQSAQSNLRESQQANKQWRWVGFDATTGQGVVRSGSEERRGKVITNGAIVPGQLVDYNEVDGFGTIKSTPRAKPPAKPKPKKHVKKKKVGEKIALYYMPSQRTQAEIGAIGPTPVIFEPTTVPSGAFPINIQHLTKTADGWVGDEWLAPVARSFTGDSENVTDTLANGQISNALDQSYAALGYEPTLTPVEYGHFLANYGDRSLYGRSIDLLVRGIPNSIFADGTASDSANNVTKTATWLQGFVRYGVPTVNLSTATATRQVLTSATYSINGSGSGLVPFSDGTTKPIAWSQNATFLSGGILPVGENLNQNLNWLSASLILSSGEENNYILTTTQRTFTGSTSAGITTETTTINNRILWRRNGAEVDIGHWTFARTEVGTVTTAFTENITPSYSLFFGGNNRRFNLVDDKLYSVNLATSNPIAGTYTVEIYQLPAMTMTTETVAANPIPDYNPNLTYTPIASYHPG